MQDVDTLRKLLPYLSQPPASEGPTSATNGNGKGKSTNGNSNGNGGAQDTNGGTNQVRDFAGLARRDYPVMFDKPWRVLVDQSKVSTLDVKASKTSNPAP